MICFSARRNQWLLPSRYQKSGSVPHLSFLLFSLSPFLSLLLLSIYIHPLVHLSFHLYDWFCMFKPAVLVFRHCFTWHLVLHLLFLTLTNFCPRQQHQQNSFLHPPLALLHLKQNNPEARRTWVEQDRHWTVCRGHLAGGQCVILCILRCCCLLKVVMLIGVNSYSTTSWNMEVSLVQRPQIFAKAFLRSMLKWPPLWPSR